LVRIEKSIEIRAPPRKVWEMLALDRWSEWMDEMKSSEYISEVRTPEDKYRVGASAHITWKRGPPKEHDDEITESLENEKMTHRSKGKYRSTITYILKPIEDGTRLTVLGDYEPPWGILGKTLAKMASGAGEKAWERALEKLKSILEK